MMRLVAWPSPVARRAVEARFHTLANLHVTIVDNEADAVAGLREATVVALHSFNYTPGIALAVRESPTLRLIQLLTTGYDRLLKEVIPPHVAIASCGESLSPVVAEHALALILALQRRIPEALALQAGTEWNPGVMARMTSLNGKTVAVVGYGSIGREIGRMAKAFGAHVVGVSRSAKPDAVADEVVALAALDEVLARADVVVAAVPLTPETRGLFDAARLARIKPGALLVNIARGPVVDTAALAAALQSGALGGAGLDVVDPEPLPADAPIWRMPNVIVTPHAAAAGGSTMLAAFCADNITRFVHGEPLQAIVTW